MQMRKFGLALACAMLAGALSQPAQAQTGRAVIHNGPAGFAAHRPPGVVTCADPTAAGLGISAGWGRGDLGGASTTFIDTTSDPWITPPPFGAGAIEQLAGAASVAVMASVQPSAAGLPISAFTGALTGVSYSHNIHTTVGPPAPAPSLIIFVDLDGDGDIDDKLIYQPALQAPPCLAGAFDTWKTCNVLDAGSGFISLVDGPTTLPIYTECAPRRAVPRGSEPGLRGQLRWRPWIHGL